MNVQARTTSPHSIAAGRRLASVEPHPPSGYSIVIPTRNRAALLRRALESVQAMESPADVAVEVLVIDNASTDDTADVARGIAGPFPVRVVREDRLGLNHGRNRGIVEASNEFLVYLDDDMEVAPGWLLAAHAALSRFGADALCGPVDPRFEAPLPSWTTPRLVASVASTYSQKGDETKVLDAGVAHELPGCNFGVWRKAAEVLGGFHPALDRSGAGLLAGGDTEFGSRLVAAGGRVLYVPGCRILHLVSRQKISFRGLARRWHGTGQTHRARELLAGKRRSRRETCGRIADILRSIAGALAAILVGRAGRAAEYCMVALQRVGYLTFRSANIAPDVRSNPPSNADVRRIDERT